MHIPSHPRATENAGVETWHPHQIAGAENAEVSGSLILV